MKIEILTQTRLAANAVFTSDWFSNPASGAPDAGGGTWVRVTARSDAYGSLVLQQADDYAVSGGSQVLTLAAQGGPSGRITQLQVAVTTQFWRVVYTNGPIAQTSFQLLMATTRDLLPAILAELQRLNLQVLGMRGPRDNPLDDSLQVIV